MFELKERIINEISVEKSKFIAIAIPFNDENKLKDFIKEVKKEYKDAKHYVYAYIIDKKIKFSDDGEPTGTAGKPILEILKYKNLNNILLIVIRYFGGILLGSGRLLRTYKESALQVFNKAKFIELIDKLKFDIEVSYDGYDLIKSYLENNHFIIIKTNFNDKIEMSFLTDLDFKNDLENRFYSYLKIKQISNYKYKKEV